MARFLSTACPGCRVAANDIGAVSMYGGVGVTDVVGLANLEILRAKMDQTHATGALERVARQERASVAAVYAYEPWVPGIPQSWEPIGTWTFPTQRVAAGSVVSFFSLDPAATTRRRNSFREYRPDGATRVVLPR